jgi:hypothetical protein
MTRLAPDGGPAGGSPEYNSWRSMLARTSAVRGKAWRNYAKRGIRVCERWTSFRHFLEDMGERPEGTTLDREDNDGIYEPGNCRWADAATQRANQRRSLGKRPPETTAKTEDDLGRGEETGTMEIATTAPPVNRLANIARGKLRVPPRCVFYGPEGVGKSTLAAHAPDPVWLDVEDGSSHLNVARYPFRDEPGGHVPRSYSDILAAIGDLTNGPHAFRTVVIDTADRLESLIWAHMVERDKTKAKGGIENIEDYGYGKGFNIAVDEWRALCSRLDNLRSKRNVGVILLAHAHVKTFKDPATEDYDRYNLQINDKAAGFLKGWADVVGFCRFDEGGGKLKGATKAKGWSTGRRLLSLMRTAAFDAKARGGMPAELELDAANPWAPFQQAVDQAEGFKRDELVALISAETVRIADPEITNRVEVAVAKLGDDTDALNRMLQQLKRQDSGKAVA